MEAIIVDKPAMKLIGLAANVTLYDVQHNRTTINLASDYTTRRAEVTNCTDEKVVYGLSTDPENYNQESDPFEYFIGMITYTPHG